MARLLVPVSSLPIHIFSTTYLIFAIFAIFSLVTFLCASHKRQEEEVFRKRKNMSFSKENLLSSFTKANNISSKALLKMISWRKQVQHEDDDHDHDDGNYGYDNRDNVDDGFEGEDAVWKKTIILGEKCRPLDFSGSIEYDSEGNLLPDKSSDDQEIISPSKQGVVA